MSTSFGRLFVLPSNDEDALSRMKIVRISAVRKWNIARSNEQRRVKFFFALFALPRKRKKKNISLGAIKHPLAMDRCDALQVFQLCFIMAQKSKRRRTERERIRCLLWLYCFSQEIYFFSRSRAFLAASSFYPWRLGWLFFLPYHHRRGVARERPNQHAVIVLCTQCSVIKVSIFSHFCRCHPLALLSPPPKLLFEAT